MHWDWVTDLCLQIWKHMDIVKLLKTVQTITTFRNPLADPMGTRRGPPLVRGPQFENRCFGHSIWLSLIVGPLRLLGIALRVCVCVCVDIYLFYVYGYFHGYFECLFWSKFSGIVDVKYYISTMHSPNCFCALTEAFVFLLMLLGLSDCRQMEKRNALLIVGTVLLRCLCVDVWNPT